MKRETFEKANEIQERIRKSLDFIKHIRETSQVHLRMNNTYSLTPYLEEEDQKLIDIIEKRIERLENEFNNL
jgi:hypothetical protein